MADNRWLASIQPRLNNLWRGVWPVGTVEPGRWLHDHELVLVPRGGCQVRIEETVHRLEAGSFLIVPPGRPHATTTLRGGVERCCIHFDWIPPQPPKSRRKLPLWVYQPGPFRAADVKRPPAFVPRGILSGTFDRQGPVLPAMEALFHRWRTGNALERATCPSLFAELLTRLLWRGPAGDRRQDRVESRAYAVKELLDVSLADPRPIQELLPTLGFSYAHLCRLFTAKFGLSPVRYRNAARLERARNLLKDPKRTVAEAAYAAGFNDPAYFSRKFHQRHGVAPSRLR